MRENYGAGASEYDLIVEDNGIRSNVQACKCHFRCIFQSDMEGKPKAGHNENAS